MHQSLRPRSLLVAAAVLAALAGRAAAAPAPMPGGANAVKGVSGHLGDTLFNSVVRLKIDELRAATPEEIATIGGVSATQTALELSALLRNGRQATFADQLRYTLADKDDVAYDIADRWVAPNPPTILQGAAAHQKAVFPIAKDFVPVKLIVTCPTCSASLHFTAFRIALQ